MGKQFIQKFKQTINNLLNKFDMSKLQEIPEPIKEALDSVATDYSRSPHTTNAGFILRLLCRIIKPTTIIKMFAHKLSK
jgi:hypothetical protein